MNFTAKYHWTAIAAACLAIAGCSTAPERGTVTDTSHTDAWIQIIPGFTTCSGNPTICTTTPMQVIPWPEAWSIEITATNGDHGWRDVTRDEYDRCPERAVFPDCRELEPEQ